MLLAYQILRLHTYQQTFWISFLDYWSLRFIFASQSSLFVYLFGFLTSLWTTKLYRERAPRQSVWPFYVLPHMRQSWETMTSVSAGHIILTPTQPVGSGRPQRELNPGPPYQESSALPTELPRPPPPPSQSRVIIWIKTTCKYWQKFNRYFHIYEKIGQDLFWNQIKAQYSINHNRKTSHRSLNKPCVTCLEQKN